MLPPKLGHILGCLAFTKYFFVTNKILPRSNHLLKIQWKILFLLFLNHGQNSSKKNLIEIWTFSFQICFRNQFSTSGSGQTESTQIRVFAYFQFDHFPAVNKNISCLQDFFKATHYLRKMHNIPFFKYNS